MQNNPSRNNSNQLAKNYSPSGSDVSNSSSLRIFSYLPSHNPLGWSSESYPAQAVTGGRGPSVQDELNDLAQLGLITGLVEKTID